MRGLKYLSAQNSFPPVLVLDPRSVFHMTYSLLSPPSSCRISRSPSRTLRCSSRARQPKCMVLFNQTVRRRASGEWSPSCFSLQNFLSSSFVKPTALFGRVPLPDSLSCFVLTPTPRGNFQRSYLEWCCNYFRVVVNSGRNFVETKLKFLARTLLR